MSSVRAISQDDVPFRYGLYRGSTQVAQVDLHIEASVPDDAWLGSLPPLEMFLAGLQLPWDEDWFSAGADLLGSVVADLPASTPSVLQANTNLEVHEHPWGRIHLFEALGFELFQEKHGYLWVDRGEPLDVTIETRSLEEVGDDAYSAVFSGVPSSGLDRNDNYYYAATGPENWARVMMTSLAPEDRSSCLIGYVDGEPIGMVGLSAFDEEDTATIAYIGVLPAHRGLGLGRRLLMAATSAARQRGFKQILSDVDVLNTPMRTAMVACGHQPDLRAWHRWAHWLRFR
ncbi:MAG TPA: GNAT family N-acetyltransferase [Acidimicrobiia bacterium]|nr:GNAT family N-acetyltransferase [Acidimicrobiia bacterium]